MITTNYSNKRALEPLEDSSRRKFQTVTDQGPPGSRSRSSSPSKVEKLSPDAIQYFKNLARDVIKRAEKGGRFDPIEKTETDFEDSCQDLLMGNYVISPKRLCRLIRISPVCALEEFLEKTPLKNSRGMILKNAFFYEAIINHAKRHSECFSLAKRAFEESQREGMEYLKLYGSYVVAAGKNGNVKEAQKAFELARKTGRVDALTYNFYVQALWDAKEVLSARNCFKEHILPDLKKKERASIFDFHGLSYAAAELYFEDIFDRSTTFLRIISGQGKHNNRNTFHEMRALILDCAERFKLKNLKWEWKINEQNPGIVHFIRRQDS